MRRYALGRQLMDIPGDRSSHAAPIPRGGGLAIVVSFLFSLVPLLIVSELQVHEALALLIGGGSIALLGFWDDHGHVSTKVRLLGHFTAAAVVLALMGGFPALSPFGYGEDLTLLWQLLGAVFLVWILNLYNFMDGIDGIAGVQAITMCLGSALMHYLYGWDVGITLSLVFAAAVAGFLVWNFPVAKIFMGDVGSGFVGFTLGVLAIISAEKLTEIFWACTVLMAAFVTDATVTLIRRGLAGEKLSEAHNNHAYQYASRIFGRHLPVTLAFGFINLAWLTPIAAMIVVGLVDPMLAVAIAYAPLLALAFYFKAGDRKGQVNSTA